MSLPIENKIAQEIYTVEVFNTTFATDIQKKSVI